MIAVLFYFYFLFSCFCPLIYLISSKEVDVDDVKLLWSIFCTHAYVIRSLLCFLIMVC